MELKDLEGKHILTGVDYLPKEYGAEAIFCLDGITYKITEDADDGYRSYMGQLEITTQKVRNTFPEQKVVVTYRGEDEEMLVFITESGKKLLAVGTDYSEDYYPMAIFDWNPELMDINQTS